MGIFRGGRIADTHTMARTRVMLCDDESAYRDLVRTVLQPLDTDAEYVEAHNGRACVEAVTEEAVDYVLIDLNMPRHDGFGAIPQLRATLPDCKIVALSTARAVDAEARCLALGADAFVEKPADIFELPTLICGKLKAAA